METVLQLLKIDLGIAHTKRDTFFNALLTSCQNELLSKGIVLDLTNNVQDQVLLSDYTAWVYRKRQENTPLSMNLQVRIRNRIMKKRSESNV